MQLAENEPKRMKVPMTEQDYLTPTESITMPPKAAAAPVPESVLKKQAATKKSAEDRAKQQAVRKQV
jgi:hypothetical protein